MWNTGRALVSPIVSSDNSRFQLYVSFSVVYCSLVPNKIRELLITLFSVSFLSTNHILPSVNSIILSTAFRVTGLCQILQLLAILSFACSFHWSFSVCSSIVASGAIIVTSESLSKVKLFFTSFNLNVAVECFCFYSDVFLHFM